MDLHKPQHNGAPKQVNITREDLTIHECHECGGTIFQNAAELGILSEVHPENNTGKPMYVNVPIAYCVKCNEPVKTQN